MRIRPAGAFGAGAASGDVEFHLVWPESSNKVQIIDPDYDGLTFGDRLVARGPLYWASDPDKNAGNAYLECFVAKNDSSGHGLYRCSYLLVLKDGALTLEGLDPPGVGSSDFAVTGGSGVYRDARGDAVFTDTSHRTDMEISLVT